MRPRARDLGYEGGPPVSGRLPAGPQNALTDVAGVKVGHCTLNEGSGAYQRGKGPVRSGVTAIIPGPDIFMQRLFAGAFVLNGAGEVSGLTQLSEWGLLESPILLTSTLSVGTCYNAVVSHLLDRHPGLGRELDVVIPVVAECDDSWLNDSTGRHVKEEHARAAIDQALASDHAANKASGKCAFLEGSVGGGTGMITCDLKAGIGTSSRQLPMQAGGFSLGCLVMSNFGVLDELRFGGLPVGAAIARALAKRGELGETRRQNYGSIVVVIATDAPLLPQQLNRLAKRAALGIGRVGSHAAHGSGEVVLAFSTANAQPREEQAVATSVERVGDRYLDPLFRAAIDATEEAILNALCAATEMVGVDDRRIPALPTDVVADLLSRQRAMLEQ